MVTVIVNCLLLSCTYQFTLSDFDKSEFNVLFICYVIREPTGNTYEYMLILLCAGKDKTPTSFLSICFYVFIISSNSVRIDASD